MKWNKLIIWWIVLSVLIYLVVFYGYTFIADKASELPFTHKTNPTPFNHTRMLIIAPLSSALFITLIEATKRK